MVEMMDETAIRMKVVIEAVDELWGKMADMQAGLPLNPREWRTVLAGLEQLIGRLNSNGREWKGSLGETN
jgi:hypothetical protein